MAVLPPPIGSIPSYWDTHRPPDRPPYRRRATPAYGSGAPPVPTVRPLQPSQPSIYDEAMGILNPQLQAAADAINRRSKMGSQAISGLTSYLAQLAGEAPGMVAGAYNPEIGLAKKTAGYSRDTLAGSGQEAGAGLGAALTQAGVSGSSDIDLSKIGAGAGGAAYGTGIAELDALIAKKSASMTRAALEPSFASGMGQQEQYMLAAQLARQLADQQGQIQGQLPGLLHDLGRDRRSDFESDRDYQLAVKNRNSALAAQRAAQTGPQAPTLAGRKAYWDSVAAQRTKDRQEIWVGTTTGIHPLIDPKTGKPTSTAGREAAQLQGVLDRGKVSRDKVKTAAARVKVVGSDASGRYLVDVITGQRIQITAPGGVKPSKPQKVKLPDGRTASWDPNTNNVTVAGGTNPTKPPPKGKARITGTAPRRVAPGSWQSRGGARLTPAQTAYWEALYHAGYVDGRGKISHPIPPGWKPGDPAYGKAGGGAGKPPGVKH